MANKSVMRRVGAWPMVRFGAVAVQIASYPALAGLLLAWVLRCLEIPSIFERWLPGSAWWLLGLTVGLVILQGVWARVIEALEGDGRSMAYGARPESPAAVPLPAAPMAYRSRGDAVVIDVKAAPPKWGAEGRNG